MHQPVAGLLHHALLAQAPWMASRLGAAVTELPPAVTLALSFVSWGAFARPTNTWGAD
jgi:hypothetical protein